MTSGLAGLIVAALAFVGSHVLLSGPLRPALVRALGERGFIGAYSLVALATFAAMVFAFMRTEPQMPLWNGMAMGPWLAASLLTIVALALFLGSLKGNPALPEAPVAGLATRPVTGAFRITRHPMMMGFALWAVAHIVVAPTPRTIVVAMAILVLALIGSDQQDRRKLRTLGTEWQGWMERTSFWPRWSELGALGLTWIVALLVWLAATWAHMPAAGIAAGAWRWLT